MIAGATLAALAIPEVMGYTKIAGMPVITGLYTHPPADHRLRHPRVVAPPRRRCGLGDGRDHGDRPGGHGAAADSTQYVELASLAALMCGVLLIARARCSSSGFIANFLSRSVLIGFLTGVGIQVAMGQVGGMFGIPSQSGGTIEKFVETAQAHPDARRARDARGVGLRPRHDRRARPRQQGDPGRAHRGRRRDRARATSSTCGAGRHRPRDRAGRPARLGPPDRGDDHGHDRRRCCRRSSRSSSSSSPRARRRRAPTR